MSFFAELREFDTTSLNTRETIVRQHLPNVSLESVRQPRIETTLVETASEVHESPLVSWLYSLGVSGDVFSYANCLLDHGFNNSDELLLADPSMQDLEAYGFVDDEDRKKVFYEIHPEAKEIDISNLVDETEDPLVVFEAILSKIEEGTATDDELEIYLRIKASLQRRI
eukprot:TRINITY_DN3235_c0_g1_i2.p1 TRINITY_DN3235_c0_g1~~TRINITY_DN3235_c0_g1_i2.p1  ORF type:complete len:169 (-),score=25.01 TRINITY_DN3235_c0_g1_i2:120-626(-)